MFLLLLLGMMAMSSSHTAAYLSSYSLPSWLPAGTFRVIPGERLRLGHLPTPVHEWRPQIDIKRDDYSGSELSGNKVRKLEFLLADALARKKRAVVTVGGIQSNHCRATAVAARRLGLEPHLILRGEPTSSLKGNLMLDRLVGANLHFVSDEEFQKKGGQRLVQEVVDSLDRAYGFPSGGSNAMGTFGYVEAVREMLDGDDLNAYERVYFACGSGGTAAGLALGFFFGDVRPDLVGLCVDDDPDFFFNKIDALFDDILLPETRRDVPPASKLLRLEQAIGEGYAVSTDDELAFIVDTARATGVVLDPVYSGKAARAMLKDLERNPLLGGRVLFIHTGGHLGLYGKDEQLQRVLQAIDGQS